MAASGALDSLEERALSTLREFAAGGPFYVSVSWGKDSVVVAHLASRLDDPPPLYWFPAGVIENPDCVLVRDAFLARWPLTYQEIPAELTSDEWDRTDGHDGAQGAFERMSRSAGLRRASGVRAEESGMRRLAMRWHGEATLTTCRPIGWWSAEHVFGYLARYDLPIHPAYAMTMGGTLDRGRVRVGTIGGRLGRSHGRAEWERAYYGREIAEIARRKS